MLLVGTPVGVKRSTSTRSSMGSQVCQVNGWKPKVFLPDAIQERQRYSWPGNVRELRNMVERLLLLADDAVDGGLVRLVLPAAEGEAPVIAAVVQSGTLSDRTDAFEREQILAELKRNHQRMTDTAKALGLERSHLYKKCQALGIDLRAMRSGA